MSNFAKVIKEEISRVARKEQRQESAALKKASSAYRSDIAALKRRVASLEQLVKKLAKGGARNSQSSNSIGTVSPSSRAEDPITGVKLRFSGARLRAQRDRQSLSAPAMAQLVGVSAQTIYNWESGQGRPNATQLATIASVRKMKKAQLLLATKGQPKGR